MNPPPEPLRLSRDLIVDEAIRLLSEEGLDGVSLRKLGSRLGVRAPSLYWHVPDKNALLAGMMEKIFRACVDSVPEHRHWQDWMRDFALALWRTQDGVRDFGRLLIGTPLSEVQIARTEEHLRQRLAGLDIAVAEALRIQGSVQVLVTGWSIFAHTPYSTALSRRMDFRARALHDLELLLEGEARQLHSFHSSGATTA
jgi:TetR/AcrR family transcriptional regulator, tetracycline repressor protein